MLRQLLTTSFTALFFLMKGWFYNFINLNGSRFSEVLLFGNSSFNNTKNTSILNTTVEYIVSSKRFKVLFLIRLDAHACLFYLPLIIFICFFSFFKFSYFHCAISHYLWLSIYTFLSCNFCIWFLVSRLVLIFSVCKYTFFKSKKACPNYLTK